MSIQIYKFNVSSGNDAAILFNASNEKLHQFMYGCVTNGYDWSFLRLEKQLFQIKLPKNANEISGIKITTQFIISN